MVLTHDVKCTHAPRQITLEELKGHKDGGLSQMALFRTARLSVQPVTAAEFNFILGLEHAPPAAAAAGGGKAAASGRASGSGKAAKGGAEGGGGGRRGRKQKE